MLEVVEKKSNLTQLLTTREKQAYAAMCLAKYCAVNQINHSIVAELLIIF
jgi:hypothetical protein